MTVVGDSNVVGLSRGSSQQEKEAKYSCREVAYHFTPGLHSSYYFVIIDFRRPFRRCEPRAGRSSMGFHQFTEHPFQATDVSPLNPDTTSLPLIVHTANLIELGVSVLMTMPDGPKWEL